jgi:tetratricopeptide (TPR) repeat protein
MLLVRRRASRADLLEWFNKQHEEQLETLLRRAGISRLEDDAGEVDRLELFRHAVDDFAPFLGPAPRALRAPQLRAAHFARPLYVLAAAYLARASGSTDVDALGEADLLRALLARHEAGHWDRWDKRLGLGLDSADQRAAVAIATLLTARGQDEALTVARLIPHFAKEPEPRLIAIARWLAQLYPAPQDGGQLVIAPLEPDRLGEVLAGDVLREHPGLLAAAIDAASDTQLTRALAVTGRAAREDQAVNVQLRDTLDERLTNLFRRGLDADGDDLLAAVITAMNTSRPVRGALDLARRFPDVLPVWLRPFAAAVSALAVDGLRTRARDDPAALPDLAMSLNTLASRLSEAGQRQEALETAREAVTHYRQLAEANRAAYLPDLAMSLNTLASRLSEAGQADEAESLFAAMISAFTDSTRGVGYVLLARGRWRTAQDRLADAIRDLTAAVSAFERDGDLIGRGQCRQVLRALRENDESTFDHAWEQAQGPLPVWLRYLAAGQQLAEKIIAWIETEDWAASKTYFNDNTVALLTDEAEAALEHLIDNNPAIGTLPEHLALLRAARTHGADTAYAAHQEQLLTRHLTQVLEQWLNTPTWAASRAFAAAHSKELLHPTAQAILNDVSNQDPADTVLRLHRGLLGYAAAAGFDAAYDLLPDTARQQAMIMDPATPAATRLAIARLHSGQADDDPEAHFQLAALTLLTILNQTAPLAREATAAIADCAANAAPFEQRDFTRRLAQIGTEQPRLAPFTAELKHILTSNTGTDPER